MGRYFEEFYRYDLPRHYLDSLKRYHKYENGKHDDSCLEGDILARLKQITKLQFVDASGITVSVKDGVALVSGLAKDQKSLDYILAAIDGVEGVMWVDYSSSRRWPGPLLMTSQLAP